jgi:hypothetical protein
MRLTVAAALAAIATMLMVVTLPAVAQAQTAPISSASPPPSSSTSTTPTAPIFRQFTASLNTNPTTGTINYVLGQTGQGGTGATAAGASGSGTSAGSASSGGGGGNCTTQNLGSLTQAFPPSSLYLAQGSIANSVNRGTATGIPYIGAKPALNPTGGLPAGTTQYALTCNGALKGVGFYTPGTAQTTAAAGPGTPPNWQAIAQTLAGSIPMPNVTIHSNPPGGTIVHLTSWFYLTGYPGGPIIVNRSAFGGTVLVAATPSSYTWNFGDGSPPLTTTSLGVPYQASFTPNPGADCNFDGSPTNLNPAIPGSITHCYWQLSKKAGYPSGFPISVTFNFNVSYSVNGGPAIPLPPITRSAATSYPAQEINTEIIARG